MKYLSDDEARSLLGEGFHTSLRKGGPGDPYAAEAWLAIHNMPPETWRSVLSFLVDGLDSMGYALVNKDENGDIPALAMWFTPDAIRDHFQDEDDDRGRWVEQASDQQLAAIGSECVNETVVCDTFRESLRRAVDSAMYETSTLPNGKPNPLYSQVPKP